MSQITDLENRIERIKTAVYNERQNIELCDKELLVILLEVRKEAIEDCIKSKPVKVMCEKAKKEGYISGSNDTYRITRKYQK